MSSLAAGWRIPVALLVLCFVPVAAGTLRLVQLAGGPEVMPADDRWAGFPVALVVHIVGAAMIDCLVVGVAAARRREFAAHRAWMIRAYAIAVAAGTQVFTQGFGEALVGHGEVRGDLLKAAGWVINLTVAEWAIRRPARRRTSRSLVVQGASA